MKAIIFSGSHSRHLYIHSEVIKHFEKVLVILMKREELLPIPPSDLSASDLKNFEFHFSSRKIVEDEKYGNIDPQKIFEKQEVIYINPDELNTKKMAEKVKNFNADFCFIFGTNLILEPVASFLPKNKINLHLGLSPWYRGAATLFWPFYFLQPQFAGVTFHQITKNPDAGEIIHQNVPILERGDTIHIVAAKCVVKAKNDIPILIDHFKKNKKFSGMQQKTAGRIFRGSDFHASKLRVIYDLFDNKIVDDYLDGKLGKLTPKIFSCLNKK
tara:strand:- start:1219 stop:2031 length:813 start_codon:yes stop_codon:yes gene_type:complete